MDNEVYDVIIVGGSINGLCMANYLVNKGIRVIVIDLKRIKNIGESHSGKIISNASVIFLKNSFNIRIPVKFIENKVDTTTLSSINGVSMNVKGEYYILDKKLFSAYLIGKIIDDENFTILEKHNVIDLVEQGRDFTGVKVQNVSRGTVKSIKGRIIVDASGSTGIIRRKVPNNRFFENEIEDFDRGIVYEECVELEEKIKNPKLFFDPSELGAGYFWAVPQKDKTVCLGIAVTGKTGNVKKKFMEYKKKILMEKDVRFLSSQTTIVPLRRPLNSFVYRNILLTGSSACQVNPLIVNDISCGIKGAYYASKAILKALNFENVHTKHLWSYNFNFMRDLGGRCCLLESVRDFFVSLSTPSFEFIIENQVVTPELVENLEDRFRRRDLFNTSRLLFKPRLLKKFLKLANYTTKMKDYYNNYPKYDDYAVWKQRLTNEVSKIRNSFLV